LPKSDDRETIVTGDKKARIAITYVGRRASRSRLRPAQIENSNAVATMGSEIVLRPSSSCCECDAGRQDEPSRRQAVTEDIIHRSARTMSQE
jgi:hypothetical protein